MGCIRIENTGVADLISVYRTVRDATFEEMICRPFMLAVLALSLFLTGCLTRQKEEPAQANTVTAPPASYPEDEKSGSSSSSTVPEKPAAAKPPVKKGVQTSYSGLQYEVLRPGTGRRPTMYNSVKVHYHGYLPNGTVFDSSVQRGVPATFGLKQVIPGWQEGIALMREGAKYRFTIPPHLAYGQRGSPPKIGPNQTLKFDVELLEVLY